MYLDEVGFSLKGVRRRTWSTRGVTPLVTLPANWEKLSTIGAITSDGRFFQQTKSGAIRSGDVIRFFQHLLRHVQGEIVVVLDNAGIHRAKATQAFVGLHERLSLVFLPPYAPELNPIELVWAYVKRNVLGNFCARSVSELKAKLVTAWQRVRYIDLPHQLMNANLCRPEQNAQDEDVQRRLAVVPRGAVHDQGELAVGQQGKQDVCDVLRRELSVVKHAGHRPGF